MLILTVDSILQLILVDMHQTGRLQSLQGAFIHECQEWLWSQWALSASETDMPADNRTQHHAMCLRIDDL